jgi:hypothetical protein
VARAGTDRLMNREKSMGYVACKEMDGQSIIVILKFDLYLAKGLQRIFGALARLLDNLDNCSEPA